VCATEAHGRVIADGVKVSLVTANIMESKTFKTHTNAYISQGRPTLKDVEYFRKGSVREIYERSIYERIFTSEPFIVNHAMTALSNELPIENHAISNQLSPVSLRRNRRVGKRDREPSRLPVRILKSEYQKQKAEGVCLQTYLCKYTEVFQALLLCEG